MVEKNWEIQKSTTTGKTLLVFKDEIDSSNAPDIEEIYSEAKKNGLDDFTLIGKPKIEDHINKYLESGSTPVSLEIELDPNFDARIITNSNKTEASLYIRKDVNSENPIDKNIINKILERSKIENLDIDSIKKSILAFSNSSERELTIPIAQGVLPKRGSDKKLVPQFEEKLKHQIERFADRLKQPELRTADIEDVTRDREFPLSEAQSITFVEKGDVIYKIEEVQRGEDGKDVYGNIIQGLPGNDPFLLDLRNIEQTQAVLKAGITGLLLIAETKNGTKLRIVPYKDATVRVVISRDKMEASLIMQAGLGAGERLSLDIVKEALYNAELLDTVSDEEVNNIIEKARSTDEECEFVFFRGVPPIPPESYKFDWAVKFPEDKRTVTVEKDELLLTAEFLLKGIDGKDVYGKKIAAKQGEVTPLPKNDDSIRVKNEKRIIKYYAGNSGELSFYDNVISVSSLKTLKNDIDETIGDIHFPGKLIITGDIKDNIKVKAKGNLTITGNAQKSLLYSEDSVVVNGGINGDGRGTVWAKDKVELQYAENARILSGNDIKITRHCFKCIVKTNGKLLLTDYPGVVIGGTINAAKGLEAVDIGAEKTIRTVVSFGQDYLVKDEIEVREKEFAENLIELKKIDKALNSNNPNMNVDEIRQKKVKLLKRNNVLNVRIFNLKENFEFHIPSKIIVKGSIYPGVVLETHGRYFEIMEKQDSVVFDFDEKTGQIFSSPIKKDK